MNALDSLDLGGPQLTSQPPMTTQVVIVYRDIAAGRRAVGLLSNLIRGPHEQADELALRVQFWRFDLLENPELRLIATAEVVAAEIIVVADESQLELGSDLERWLERCFLDREGQDTAVVALLGPPESRDGPDSARLQSVQSSARKAGLHFFAPLPKNKDCTASQIERIHQRAEAFTPTLDHILQEPERAASRWNCAYTEN
ncbi:MAG TPA: hypothetical protein VMF06_06710 [Candidatus Limnocylindria bacterium]|nr:hypothetical protein [Candidatus Limnocylindria bacterium]